MAFFKFRKGADSPAPPPPESIDAMRRRARYRLTGAAVLVLAGVIGFPLLFDTQPRPVAVDIAIEIPDRNKVKPLGSPASVGAPPSGVVADPALVPGAAVAAAQPPAAKDAAAAAKAETPAAKSEERLVAGAEPRPESRPDARADTRSSDVGERKTESKAESRAENKAADKNDGKPAARAEQEASKAKALLEGKPAQAPAAAASVPAGEARYVVQVGAFADAAKAQDTRQKVERSGLKTYTHVAETKEGKRTRVRVGPFSTRSEADKAAAKIKELDLPASVLTL